MKWIIVLMVLLLVGCSANADTTSEPKSGITYQDLENRIATIEQRLDRVEKLLGDIDWIEQDKFPPIKLP